MKKILTGIMTITAITLLSLQVFAAEVEDITQEVLTGPSELDPSKILGPGGIAIGTYKDIMMSFGATVRFIPTFESDWDFGMSKNLEGYFYTEPIKDYARTALNTGNSIQDIYSASAALNNTITSGRGDSAVIAAFDNFANAFYQADGTEISPAVAPTIGALANSVDTIQTLVDSAEGNAAKAAIIKAAVTTPSPQLNNANLLQTSDALAAGFAAQVTKNPDATSANLTDAVAYLNVLKAKTDSFQPYYLANSFLRSHTNESGSVNDGYIRTETKLYFNAMPKDKKWGFYAALEYDKPIDTQTVDNRGGKDSSSSNFGLERLNASIELAEGLRFHGGWDVWGLDIIESASMVYGDDNPGFWFKGDYDKLAFSVAWLKLEENDFQNDVQNHTGANDEDRDLIAGYADYRFDGTEKNKIRFFYAYDRIRDVPSLDLIGAMADEAGLADYAGIYGNYAVSGTKATSPVTDAHTVGAYYLGNIGIFEMMAEGAYKFGTAKETGLKGVDNGVSIIQYDDFDISSYALAADIGLEFKDIIGWQSFRPHIGFTYTSGDDNSDDDTLGGYSGATNAQRFSNIWGGENTIIGDTNFALGTVLYGYIPELYGNGTPVFVGGLQNFAGTGNGRGDNPGLTMYSFGLTLRPKIFLIYRTNANMFCWNENFYAGNMVNPAAETESGSLVKTRYTKVESGYVGTEWDNEITLALNKNMFVKGQASLFFPGDTVKDVTSALSGGTESDEIASRLGFEFIWNF